MTPTELRALLARLGWPTNKAARLLGVPYRTLHAALDPGPHHRDLRPSALLLAELADDVPSAREWLLERERS